MTVIVEGTLVIVISANVVALAVPLDGLGINFVVVTGVAFTAVQSKLHIVHLAIIIEAAQFRAMVNGHMDIHIGSLDPLRL